MIKSEMGIKPRALVVDDDHAILELLRFTLDSSGFEVVIAQDDEEFCKQAWNFKPHVVILDIMLLNFRKPMDAGFPSGKAYPLTPETSVGNKDGVRIYEQLLREGFKPNIPVIFLSVLASDRPATPPQPGRTYALVGKPFDPERLVNEINCLLAA